MPIPPEVSLTQEAEQLVRIAGGDLYRVHDLLDRQFAVLQNRAQILVSIAGIVVTVTGFSGRIIAGTHLIGQILVLAGLFTVLASAVYVIRRVMRIRWLTALMADAEPATIAAILEQRERKRQAFYNGGAILLIGLTIYCCAVAVMLLQPGR